MEERREFVRLDTRMDVAYSVLSSQQPTRVVTKNISGGGICFFSDRVLRPGTRLQVTMKLPDREEPLRFMAEVAWSEQYEMIGKAQRQRSVEVGVQLLDISPQDRDAIMQHVILTIKSPQAGSPP